MFTYIFPKLLLDVPATRARPLGTLALGMRAAIALGKLLWLIAAGLMVARFCLQNVPSWLTCPDLLAIVAVLAVACGCTWLGFEVELRMIPFLESIEVREGVMDVMEVEKVERKNEWDMV